MKDQINFFSVAFHSKKLSWVFILTPEAGTALQCKHMYEAVTVTRLCVRSTIFVTVLTIYLQLISQTLQRVTVER